MSYVESKKALEELFSTAWMHSFDGGAISPLKVKIEELIFLYQEDVVRALRDLISEKDWPFEIVSQVFKDIGDIHNKETHEIRFQLLIEGLSRKEWVDKCGACFGLAYLRDKRAIPVLRLLLEKESDIELITVLEQTVEELEGSDGKF